MINSTDLYHTLPSHARKEKVYIWEKNNLSAFNELIIGWNAQRPEQGQYHISLSLKMEEWSPWFSYAYWGSNTQRSFEHRLGSIHVFQDTVNISENIATGWRVKVEAEDVENLQRFYALYATFPPTQKKQQTKLSYVCLEVSGISQIKINDPRSMRICSPTSTTAVIRFLNKHAKTSPLDFADKVWDSHFDIYGHWVFAAAQAYAELGEEWETKVMYLNGFEDIYTSLRAGYPVVVSVRGFLPGALHPYSQGHLLVVCGYSPEKNKVLCMDPAYPEDVQTHVAYDLDDFLLAWQRRKNIAYIFQRSHHRIDIPIG
jgi:hypothetical protein